MLYIYNYNKLNMRFEFCGNIDCPEWVLSEVVQLNKISAIKLKLVL
jgi:hypothetical protein